MTMTILMIMMTMMMTTTTTTKSLGWGLGSSLYDLKTTHQVFWHMTLHRLVTDISEMKYIIAALGISKLAKRYTATRNLSVCERYMCYVRALKNIYLRGIRQMNK